MYNLRSKDAVIIVVVAVVAAVLLLLSLLLLLLLLSLSLLLNKCRQELPTNGIPCLSLISVVCWCSGACCHVVDVVDVVAVVAVVLVDDACSWSGSYSCWRWCLSASASA